MKKKEYRIPEYKIVRSLISFLDTSTIRLFVDRKFPKNAKFDRKDPKTGDFIFTYEQK